MVIAEGLLRLHDETKGGLWAELVAQQRQNVNCFAPDQHGFPAVRGPRNQFD
jgi:hypothetical protein